MARKHFRNLSPDFVAVLSMINKVWNTINALGISAVAGSEMTDFKLSQFFNPIVVLGLGVFKVMLGIFIESYKKDDFDL